MRAAVPACASVALVVRAVRTELTKESYVTTTLHGYPRIGANRELKRATEAYWAGRSSADELRATAATLRRDTWLLLRDAGVQEIPSNDFSLYDQVLDTIALVGAAPRRYVTDSALDTYFAMARGTATTPALEMTKWFDTNYHYLVPEFSADSTFTLAGSKPVDEFREALALGITTRPVLLGPVTFLRLGKATGTGDFDPLALLDRLLPVYEQVLSALADAGADWVQLDEPALAQDQPPAVVAAAARAYDRLGALDGRPKLLVASYFDALGDAMPVLAAAPVDGLALDFTGPAAANLDQLAAIGGIPGKRLVAGVVDGRNVWVNDLERSLATLATLLGLAGEVVVAPSCSLQHVPLDLAAERRLDPQVGRWLAFARQKVDEVVTLGRGLRQGTAAIGSQLAANRAGLASRAASAVARNQDVRDRVAAVTPAELTRTSPYPDRVAAQRQRLSLPLLPTTTIGSFPQTAALRSARAELRARTLDQAGYDERIRAEIAQVIAVQEKLGLDVLVHGEAERNDMVQYFAEQLTGFVVTDQGWVQSYGSRYVRPPILAGDVSRPAPMTVEWSQYAQSLTDVPVKGMLTGPVTMLHWSFVRDDQPLADTARQVALALRDEVRDLEQAGIAVIQVDEPALREGLPLRRAAHKQYLEWAVDAFRLATAGVRDDTQIHTHMCYAEFGDILDAIAALDADVISLEAARSNMELARDLTTAGYTRGIGPGVYDIHSPRVPTVEEMTALLTLATGALRPEQLWVNPDCGLKTRGYDEVEPALRNLVAAAAQARAAVANDPVN
jgi:5-methyltetrahydropteroyltriglutamate--homocysteine methyltransferase